MAFKMNGSPAKMGTIKGTAGHSSALKQKKSETIETIKKEMDPKVREALESFNRPTPGLKTKKPTKAQIKNILEKMKSVKGPGVQLSDDHKKTIEGVEKMIKDQKSPAKQQGPTPEKNPDLMEGEMEGTYVYEGKDNRERIIDLEERAGFLTDNDIPDLEDSKDPKDIKRVKQLRATVKKLQHEADILRNRKPNKK